MQRRQFIMLGLGAGVGLSLGLTLYPVLQSSTQQRSDAATLVLDALLPALLQGALPAEAAAQQAALRRSRDAVLQFLPFLPRRQQAELQQLFLLLQQRLGQLALLGHWLSLNEMPLPSRLQLLSSWRDSYLVTLQQAYHGLRELLYGAYYGQPQHWPALKYQPLEFNPMYDPIAEGLTRGWRHIDASTLTTDQQFDTDVVIIGTGAGGGIAAELLTQAGFKVLMLEHGALYSSSDFRQQERWAYPQLYQDGAGRKTKDQAISILQGRTVGGSTTVNWTTSIRTPANTLQYWEDRFGLDFASTGALEPFLDLATGRLNISEWALKPNHNNGALQRGCQALGWQYTVIHRNVKGCANTGYCGMGCPLNAKQSMLVTTIPVALDGGATLISRVSARELVWRGNQIQELWAVPVDAQFQTDPRLKIRIRARHYVLAGGAINSPALLLRSKVPDPSGRLGKHTYLHPSVISGALFAEAVNGHQGAPQSIYSDQFVWPDAAQAGFKLEVPPLHPVLMASKLTGMAEAHADLMRQFNHLQVMIALLRDGFHPDAQGGAVQLDSDGEPQLDYPLTDYLWDGVRRAYLAMAELQFAAGAAAVLPVHDDAQLYRSWSQAKAAIAELPLQRYRATLASAHVMGGCNMSADPATGVVDSFGAHQQLKNLTICDGSILPSSLGANPQLTIYALSWRISTELIKKLSV